MSDDMVLPIELWTEITVSIDNDTLFNLMQVRKNFFLFALKTLEESPQRFERAIYENNIYPFNLLRMFKKDICGQRHYIRAIIHDRLEIFSLLKANQCMYDPLKLGVYIDMYKPKKIIKAHCPPSQSVRDSKETAPLDSGISNSFESRTDCTFILKQNGSRFCFSHKHFKCVQCPKNVKCCHYGNKFVH